MSDAEIVVGRVVRPHGLRGQLVIHPSGDPDIFFDADQVVLDHKGQRRPVRVRDVRFQGKLLLVAFEEFADRTAAEPFIGSNIIMRRDELPEPEEGEHYISSLIGRPVTKPSGEVLGKIVDVELSDALTWLVVETASGRRLVPFTEPLVMVEADRIVIDAPAGLIEGEPE